MSLTSYRAAPPRDRVWGDRIERYVNRVIVRFGGDLLSQGLSPSTIGAVTLNFRVRDGTGCFTRAMITKPNKRLQIVLLSKSAVSCVLLLCMTYLVPGNGH